MDKFNSLVNCEVSKKAKLYNGIRMVNSVIEDYTTIGDDCDIINLRTEDKVELGRRNFIRDTVIGRGSYTGTNTIIKNTDIGRFCCISWNVSIGGGNHDYHHVSMYTDYWYHRNFGIAPPKRHQKIIRASIGNDVWIGAGAIINNGVTIGNGCVIGAGSVIVRDMPSWSIVVGVPGRVIKRRFDENMSEALEKLKWWNWRDELIVKYHNILSSVSDIDQIYRIMEEIDVQNFDK